MDGCSSYILKNNTETGFLILKLFTEHFLNYHQTFQYRFSVCLWTKIGLLKWTTTHHNYLLGQIKLTIHYNNIKQQKTKGYLFKISYEILHLSKPNNFSVICTLLLLLNWGFLISYLAGDLRRLVRIQAFLRTKFVGFFWIAEFSDFSAESTSSKSTKSLIMFEQKHRKGTTEIGKEKRKKSTLKTKNDELIHI